MSKSLPSFSVYGPYTNGNYGAHALRFDVNGGSFWFSYKTLVAFQKGHGDIIVHTNDWGTTTGKHLNSIDDGNKKTRLSDTDFQRVFEKTFGREVANA